jgi:hypothetical protein
MYSNVFNISCIFLITNRHESHNIRNVTKTAIQVPGDTEMKSERQQFEEKYDLGCLCEVYYNECNIIIAGGCEIAKQRCCKNEHKTKDKPHSEKYVDKNKCDRDQETMAMSNSDDNELSKVESKKNTEITLFNFTTPKTAPDLHDATDMCVSNEKFTQPCHPSCVTMATPNMAVIEECIPKMKSQNTVSCTANVAVNKTEDDANELSFLNKKKSTTIPHKCCLEFLNLSGCFQITDTALR